ncbi:MAG TPA: DUF4190 domain-containing protein [Pyrinomonadaceae bacterium]|nr:DUF4190 domain-containing protein [Pyrinomonadaceae bacterium]
MKRCPTCNLTFEEDWLTFCTQDGTTLVDESADASEPAPAILPPVQPDAPVWSTPTVELPPSSPEWRPPQRPVPEWRPPPPPYVQSQSKSLATASMVLGLLSVTIGWLCMGPMFAVAAIVLGAVSLSQMKKTPDRVGGKPMALIGVVTGGLAIVGIIIFYIFVIIVGTL